MSAPPAAPSAAAAAAASSAAASRVPRILACVLCQTRKIKCDRNTPCSNCVKANMTCVPSTPAPARKRRRPNQDLQQRLARCEELLTEYATAKPQSTPTESTPSEESWKGHGKLIFDDGGSVKFVDSYLWGNVHNELKEMRQILDDDMKDDMGYSTPTETASPDQNASLLLVGTPNTNLDDVYPDPAHVFLLWQTFLDRVNPLTKVIHVPTLQPSLLQAATSRETLAKNTEALLFSVFLMAAVSLSEDECVTLLGYPKEQAVQQFSDGVRVILSRIGILKSYDLTVLQALVLYMTSLSGRYDRHASWIMNGVVIRIAQKMGLHRDGESLGLSVFDAEMRRRIWWQIVMLDSSYALMSGLGQNMLPRTWDTKEPSNLNDSDLFPTMTSIQPRNGPTEMIFPLVIYEMAKVLIDSPELEGVIFQNEMGFGSPPNPAELEKAQRRIDGLDQSMAEVLEKYGDPSSGAAYELARDMRPTMLYKIREMITPPRDQPEWGNEIQKPTDNVFKLSVTHAEHNLAFHKIVEKRGYFRWFVMTNFQIEVMIYMVGQLYTRTTGQLVDRGWHALGKLYDYQKELYNTSIKANLALAGHTMRAWKRRAKALQEVTGSPAEVPAFIVKLASMLSMDDPRNVVSTESSPNVPKHEDFMQPFPTSQSNGTNVWPWEVSGLNDLGSLDWDMFGPAPQAQINYGGQWSAPQPPAGGTSTNSWM